MEINHLKIPPETAINLQLTRTAEVRDELKKLDIGELHFLIDYIYDSYGSETSNDFNASKHSNLITNFGIKHFIFNNGRFRFLTLVYTEVARRKGLSGSFGDLDPQDTAMLGAVAQHPGELITLFESDANEHIIFSASEDNQNPLVLVFEPSQKAALSFNNSVIQQNISGENGVAGTQSFVEYLISTGSLPSVLLLNAANYDSIVMLRNLGYTVSWNRITNSTHHIGNIIATEPEENSKVDYYFLPPEGLNPHSKGSALKKSPDERFKTLSSYGQMIQARYNENTHTLYIMCPLYINPFNSDELTVKEVANLVMSITKIRSSYTKANGDIPSTKLMIGGDWNFANGIKTTENMFLIKYIHLLIQRISAVPYLFGSGQEEIEAIIADVLAQFELTNFSHKDATYKRFGIPLSHLNDSILVPANTDTLIEALPEIQGLDHIGLRYSKNGIEWNDKNTAQPFDEKPYLEIINKARWDFFLRRVPTSVFYTLSLLCAGLVTIKSVSSLVVPSESTTFDQNT